MKIHFSFQTTSPVLNCITTFGGMPVSNCKRNFVDVFDRFVESCDLTINDEYYIPTLLATVSESMKYWRVFNMVDSVSKLQNLVESVIIDYTMYDLSKCIEWDDFDDFITTLLITVEYIKNGRISESDLKYFNTADDE
jgi:hypothetical protein